jgi:hypothetical protein
VYLKWFPSVSATQRVTSPLPAILHSFVYKLWAPLKHPFQIRLFRYSVSGLPPFSNPETDVPMKVSPTEAADIANVTRKTLYADMSKGHLSFEVTDKGKRLIQVAELERVYSREMSNRKEAQGNAPASHNTANISDAARTEIDAIRQKLENVEAERQRERNQLTDQIDHLRDMLKSEQEERRKVTALLTDQRDEKDRRGEEGDKKLHDLEVMIDEMRKQQRRILTEMNHKNRSLWQRLFSVSSTAPRKGKGAAPQS